MGGANRQPRSNDAYERIWLRETDTRLYRNYLIYIFYIFSKRCQYCTGNTDLQTTAHFPMQNCIMGWKACGC